MSAWQRTLHRLDDVQQRHPWSAFPAAVIRKFGDDGAGGLAALIAYYGFFSLFPLMLVVVSVASSVLRNDPALQARIVDSAIAQFPIVGTQIRDNVGSVAGSPLAIVIGIGGALWAGLAVVSSVKTAMDEIWDVPRRKRGSVIPRVLRASLVLVTLGVTVTAAALAAGAATSLGPFGATAGLVIAVVLNVGTMLVVFRVLTVADVSWRDVLPGAVLAGVSWTILQTLGGYFLERKITGASNVYGTFAVVIGLLWWLFIGAQLTVVAAEVNVVLRRHLWPRSFFPPPTEPADERALTLQARQEEAVATERVSVDFDRVRPGRAAAFHDRASPTRARRASAGTTGGGGSPMPTTAQVMAWAEAYRQAWENADTPAAVALFAEDSSYRSNIFEEPYLGRKGVEEYWSTVTAMQSDVKVWMGQPVIEGDRVIVEFWTRMLGGGEPLTLVGNLLMRFDDDGLCTDLREYWQLLPELRDPWPGWGE